MAQDTNAAEAARRSVHALIHVLGATCVQLQMPAPPIAGDDGEELGLRAPEFQARQLAPVAVRRTKGDTEILVPADALENLLGVQGAGAVRAAMAAASAVLVADESFVPLGTEAVMASGRECLYRLRLRPLGTEVV